MATGMQIFLDDGSDVQIDDNFFNLAMKGKYKVQCVPSNTTYSGSVTVTGISPISAFIAPSYASLHSIRRSGNQFTFNFIVNVAQELTVYIFDVPESSGSYGLQIFNDYGAITFDSSRSYMRIAQALSFSDYETQTGYAHPTPSPGRTYAVLQSAFIGYRYGVQFMPGESGPIYYETSHYTVMMHVDSSGLYLAEVMTFNLITAQGLQGEWQDDNRSGEVQLVDVTNM